MTGRLVRSRTWRLADCSVAVSQTAKDLNRGARALAIGPRSGLTVAELRGITGYKFAVRPILDAYPAFVPGEKGRWHLGIPATPPG